MTLWNAGIKYTILEMETLKMNNRKKTNRQETFSKDLTKVKCRIKLNTLHDISY